MDASLEHRQAFTQVLRTLGELATDEAHVFSVEITQRPSDGAIHVLITFTDLAERGVWMSPDYVLMAISGAVRATLAQLFDKRAAPIAVKWPQVDSE